MRDAAGRTGGIGMTFLQYFHLQIDLIVKCRGAINRPGEVEVGFSEHYMGRAFSPSEVT